MMPVSSLDVDVDDVVFLSVKEAADAKVKINALIREGKELTWWALADILGKNLAHLYLMMILSGMVMTYGRAIPVGSPSSSSSSNPGRSYSRWHSAN